MQNRYHSNSWLIKIASNGRYIAAPTFHGEVFFFNIKTGTVSAILRDHEEMEIRDVLFHPYKPLFFSCADGEFSFEGFSCDFAGRERTQVQVQTV
jgi:hypothetical protein